MGSTKKKKKAHGVFENTLSLIAVRERQVDSTVAQVLKQVFLC